MEPFRDKTRYPYYEEVLLDILISEPETAEMTGQKRYIDGIKSGKVSFDRELNNTLFVSGASILTGIGQRLKNAMGTEQVLSRSHYQGGEFRVPNYRSYVEGLEHALWQIVHEQATFPQIFSIVPYNHIYDGWTAARKDNYRNRSGFTASALCPYEYAYEFWDERVNGSKTLSEYIPDLYDNGTFGVWLNLLPEPATVSIVDRTATICWGEGEPRVHRSSEMGRYLLPVEERTVTVTGYSWRHARAEVYVRAWEKMVANEPEDKYKSIMLAQHANKENA